MRTCLFLYRSNEHQNDYNYDMKGHYQPCPTTYGVIQNQTCARHNKTTSGESPYMRMCHQQQKALTSSVNAYCTTRKCAVAKDMNGSTYCSYGRVHSDLDLTSGDTHLSPTSTMPVTYVCRHNRDHDKLTQIPEIVKDSQNCTILRNKIEGFQRKEHDGSTGQLSASRSCENLWPQATLKTTILSIKYCILACKYFLAKPSKYADDILGFARFASCKLAT